MEKKPSGWWLDKEHCREAALECSTHSELRDKYPVLIRHAKSNGWYDEITSHMPPLIEKITKEECIEAALLYNTRGEFRTSNPRAYDKACCEGWLDEICSHMVGRIKRKAGYWDNIEHCKEVALQYSNRPELRKHEKGCHDAILKNGWQEECFAHMNSRVKEYTIEQIADIAKKYNTYKDFREQSLGAYHAAKVRGILDEVCKHMVPRKPVVKYDCVPTLDMCKEAALKYNTRGEFQKQDKRLYGYAKYHNWLDDICAHMKRVGNKNKRCIYAAFFHEDHSVYIGLTFNAKRRWQDHVSDPKSTISIHAKDTGYTPDFIQLTDYMDSEEASIQEGIFLNKYKEDGWNILNRVKTGALGSVDKGYTKQEVLEAASKFKSLKEFRLNDAGHYEAGYRSDYWDEVRAVCKPHTRIFTDDQLREIASDCHTLAELRKKDHAALEAAKSRGILDDICAHMDRSNEKTLHRFTDQEIRETASKYEYRIDFSKNHHGMYEKIRRQGRINEFCSHMKEREPLWTYETLKQEALKYRWKSEFQSMNKSAYNKACKLGIMNEICSHMTVKPRDVGYKCDTIEDAIELASKCFCRSELLKKYPIAYKKLKAADMIDTVLPKIPSRWDVIWTEDKRREVALECSSRSEFKEKFPQAYEVTREKGQLDEFCSHMTKKKGGR